MHTVTSPLSHTHSLVRCMTTTTRRTSGRRRRRLGRGAAILLAQLFVVPFLISNVRGDTIRDGKRVADSVDTKRVDDRKLTESREEVEDEDVPNLVLAELGMGGAGGPSQSEHGYCELCIYAIHQVQYGELPSCQGSSRASSYDACSQVTQSMLAFAQDTMHLISYGCYQYDVYKGWQTVKPCPAHVICGRLPNVYDTQQQTMCPADFHYRFPHALGNRAPTVFNPLLKYAVSQYKGVGMSSVLQSPGQPANLPRFKRQAVSVLPQQTAFAAAAPTSAAWGGGGGR